MICANLDCRVRVWAGGVRRTEPPLGALQGRGLLARHGVDRLEGVADAGVVPRLLPAAQLLYLLCACMSRRVVSRLTPLAWTAGRRRRAGARAGAWAAVVHARTDGGARLVFHNDALLPSVVRGMRARRVCGEARCMSRQERCAPAGPCRTRSRWELQPRRQTRPCPGRRPWPCCRAA